MKTSFDLQTTWRQLACVTSLNFRATSETGSEGWNGAGQGSVIVETIDLATMLFRERGTWKSDAGKEFAFSNVYRWTALPHEGSIRLEHLRFGESHPVYLFDLQQTDETTWLSSEPHVCREDLYSAKMTLEAEAISLHWIIRGPTKNESIRYRYV